MTYDPSQHIQFQPDAWRQVEDIVHMQGLCTQHKYQTINSNWVYYLMAERAELLASYMQTFHVAGGGVIGQQGAEWLHRRSELE